MSVSSRFVESIMNTLLRSQLLITNIRPLISFIIRNVTFVIDNDPLLNITIRDHRGILIMR